MDLDEKTAKKVLDFLLDRFAAMTCAGVLVLYDNAGNCIPVKDSSCKSILQAMLEMSSNGKDILIYNALVVMKKGTTLEQILVEMDLSNALPKS